MSDLIDRQKVVDALIGLIPFAISDEATEAYSNGLTDAYNLICQLPSAEPERPPEIQDILNYLDTVLHPIISPEHWDVYSELHDMISTLPSSEPKLDKKDMSEQGDSAKFGVITGETCAYWDRESNICALHRPSAQPEQRWIPCSERMPNSNGCYLVWRPHSFWGARGMPAICYFDGQNAWHDSYGVDFERILHPDDVTAWMPLPEPYREEETHENR